MDKEEIKKQIFSMYLSSNKMSFKEYVEKVRSTNVDKVKWDSKTKEMKIKFDDGSIYLYYNVPEKVYDNIVDGMAGTKTSGEWGPAGKFPSVGASVNQSLGGYSYVKVRTF